MKKLTYCLLMAVSVFLLTNCSKSNNDNPPSANSKLIVATYTATKIEGSNTNNGSDWTDITRVGAREVLTIKSDNSFNSTSSNPTTGATAAPVNGTWSLSADGNTLTYAGIQSYTIQTLTSTSLVTVLVGPNKLGNADTPVWAYYRFTYTRS